MSLNSENATGADAGSSGNDVTGSEDPVDVALGDLGKDDLLALRVWLQKNLKYPKRARRRGIEGTVLLSIVLDQSGYVKSHMIVSGSGHKILDEAALKMLLESQPLPGFQAENYGAS